MGEETSPCALHIEQGVPPSPKVGIVYFYGSLLLHNSKIENNINCNRNLRNVESIKMWSTYSDEQCRRIFVTP